MGKGLSLLLKEQKALNSYNSIRSYVKMYISVYVYIYIYIYVHKEVTERMCNKMLTVVIPRDQYLGEFFYI